MTYLGLAVAGLAPWMAAAETWAASRWISAADAPVADAAVWKTQRAADGTAVFAGVIVNPAPVTRAVWKVTALGVFECAVNGVNVGEEILKPGFTHVGGTRRSFTYDVTPHVARKAGARNVFSAEVSSGWWRDKIVNYVGKRSAFRGELTLTFADGTSRTYGTQPDTWRAATGGPVRHAGIFDGEEIDARCTSPAAIPETMPPAVANTEFGGEILPSEGAEVYRRYDKTLSPREAYAWKGVTGADPAKKVFGRVVRVRAYGASAPMALLPGETLVIDFGQNAAAHPTFTVQAAAGTTVTVLPAEMLNDANGERSRGNDGPAGSVYRENLRMPDRGMRLVYTCRGDAAGETCLPRFTFFGYRYVSVTATAPVAFTRWASIPVTSISAAMERGSIETGDASVNRLIANVYWGQLSNYLSIPTDCPQRNERLGWTADTQVFCEAGAFNADTSRFFHKWMRDMRDSQGAEGGFPGVAPMAQYGNEKMRLGWSDAGIIVPYQIWRQFGDTAIVDENWAAMERCLARQAATKYRSEKLPECRMYQWNDWLSLTKYESCAYKPEYSAFRNRKVTPEALTYWNYLGGCYWLWDARLMAAMAKGTGRAAAAAKYERMAAEAKAYLRTTFFKDGALLPIFDGMQTPALFALKLGLVEGAARTKTLDALKASIRANGGRLHTGFLGTSIAMDTLTENGLADLAYDIFLGHAFPGWLYSVDQGATTVWERWNSYVKETGFGPVGMNSFNHYAYGCVLAWMYRTVAGISADVAKPGFRNIVMAPKPDRRLGHVTARYRTPWGGEIRSAWRYAADGTLTWDFTVPEGATADVTYPWGGSRKYGPGTHRVTGK